MKSRTKRLNPDYLSGENRVFSCSLTLMSWLAGKVLYPNGVSDLGTNCTPHLPHFQIGVSHSRHEQLATLPVILPLGR